MRPRIWSMRRLQSARAAALSGLIACGILIAAAQPAAAELVDRSHEHIAFTDEFVVCDVPVTFTADIVNNTQERIARSGFPLFKSTGAGTAIFTNPETGKSVSNHVASTSKDLTVTDNGDGTITVRTAITGLAEQWRLSDGTIAIMDVGRIVLVTVLNYNGTPTDTSDDQVVSDEIESISGPHPDLESDFELFCATFVPAVT
jgi:hypothetical protein